MPSGITIFLLEILAVVVAGALYLSRQFGRLPKKGTLKTSNHRDDRKFFNRETVEIPVQQFARDWTFFAFLFRSNHAPKSPWPRVAISARDFVLPPPREMTLRWLGHSFTVVEVANLRLVIDPVFGNAAPVPGICRRYQAPLLASIAELGDLDLVLLTHDHYDHLEYATIRALQKSAVHFITLPGVGARLQGWGIPAARITELDWHETLQRGDLTIRAVESRHFSGRTLTDRFQTLWGGFILSTPQQKLFWGGDGGYGSHFAELGQQYGPFEVAALEIDAWNAHWPEHHMTPEQAVQAAQDLQAKNLWPIHWGVFDLANHPATESIERTVTAAQRHNVPLTTPQMGEKFTLNALPQTKWWR